MKIVEEKAEVKAELVARVPTSPLAAVHTSEAKVGPVVADTFVLPELAIVFSGVRRLL